MLRAKIDMASPNFNMRDPTLYRIRHATHHRTGDAWCIYPMYDFAHPLSDAIERITHSLCTLEFEDHRPLYDWLVEQPRSTRSTRPQQIEFARLNLNYTVMSKRKLLQLVQQGHVSGWDDPRMPTISGLRRRGYTPESIRDFCARIGVAKKENVIDVAQLEHSVREDLNRRAPRVMAVLRPLKVVLTNYPEGQVEEVDVINNPEDAVGRHAQGAVLARAVHRAGRLHARVPPKKFFRLSPGKEVRLRCAYFITCTEVVKDDARRNRRAALHLRSGDARRRRAGRPPGEGDAALGVGGARGAAPRSACTIGCSRSRIRKTRRRARRFSIYLNPHSLEVLRGCQVEPSLAGGHAGHARPVRAARLLLRRPRLAARRARLQPHGLAARHLGQDRAKAGIGIRPWNITSRSTISSRARSRSSTSRSSSASSPARRPPRKSCAG